jgi:peroxiredoxin (alkyl hydroperoxide reductase subunit C)
MLSVGDTLPDLELEAYHKDEINKLHLNHFRGQWLVMVFYPGDFTFICPTELAEIGTHYEAFQKLGAEVLSVSTDSVYVHKAWHDTSKMIKTITYPMLADPAGELTKAFGIYLEQDGQSLRGSYIIDPDGVIQTVEIHANNIGRSASELYRKLEAAKYVREHGGEVCPANWKPGETTLKPGLDLVGKL